MPSPPVVIYHDDFSSYPLGSFPTGWIGGSASRVVVDSLGFYNRCLQVGINQIAQDLRSLYSTATVYFCFSVEEGTPGKYVFAFTNSPTSITNQTVQILNLVVESDSSLSLYGPNNSPLIGNTGLANGIINFPGWNYVQINVTLGTFTRTDGAICMTVTCDLGLNGTSYITGAFKQLPNLVVGGLFYPGAVFNWWEFSSPNINGGLIADIYMCQLTELNLFPFDFTGMTYTRPSKSNIFVSQGFIELMEQCDVGNVSQNNARVSQGFIEVVELPLIQANPLIEFPNLRVSQVFIELMTENDSTPPPAQGGHVYES